MVDVGKAQKRGEVTDEEVEGSAVHYDDAEQVSGGTTGSRNRGPRTTTELDRIRKTAGLS